MNREQKLLHNQQVRRIALLVNLILRNVVALPQAVIDLILKDLKRTLYVQPLRPLTLTLPPTFQQFALNPIDTESPHRSYYNRFGAMPDNWFSTLDPSVLPRRADWAHPTQFDEMVTGSRYLTGREDPVQRIVEGFSGLGLYGGRLGYGSFQ